MKSNEEYLKDLFCSIYIQTSLKNSPEIANKDAVFAVNNFNIQFGNTEMITTIDDGFVKIYNETIEKQMLEDLIHIRNYRFQGCTSEMSKKIIPSKKIKFPYWLKINDNATVQVEPKNPR